jgi:hypothetical protein
VRRMTMRKTTVGLKSDDPNKLLRALKVIAVCHMLWEDKKYDLVKRLAGWAEEKEILTADEISSLREVRWDLNEFSSTE